jgi:hypothetical protein
MARAPICPALVEQARWRLETRRVHKHQRDEALARREAGETLTIARSYNVIIDD